jgi:hypothetical protein
MELAQNLTDLPPDTSCQITKYQSVTDILNLLGLGVKISSIIVESFGVSKPSNCISSYCLKKNGSLFEYFTPEKCKKAAGLTVKLISGRSPKNS